MSSNWIIDRVSGKIGRFAWVLRQHYPASSGSVVVKVVDSLLHQCNSRFHVGMGTLEFRICRIRIRAISDPNPAVLSAFWVRIFLAIIQYCVTVNAYCSAWDSVVIWFARLCAFNSNAGHFVRYRRSFWKLCINLLLNSPQRHIHWTSE